MLRLLSIKAEGFKNLEIKTPLEFPAEGNILIMGLNESGKSTLFEAIYFALTGQLLVKHKKQSLVDSINFLKNKALVELRFIKNNTLCTIHREVYRRGDGATDTVEFQICYDDHVEVYKQPNFKKQEIQDFIEKFVNFDGSILLNSCFVQQKDLDGFINTPKRKKDEIIHKLLGLKNIATLRNQYNEEIKTLEILSEYFNLK